MGLHFRHIGGENGPSSGEKKANRKSRSELWEKAVPGMHWDLGWEHWDLGWEHIWVPLAPALNCSFQETFPLYWVSFAWVLESTACKTRTLKRSFPPFITEGTQAGFFFYIFKSSYVRVYTLLALVPLFREAGVWVCEQPGACVLAAVSLSCVGTCQHGPAHLRY